MISDWSLFPNFSPEEFACSHCGKNEMQPEYLQRLQALRRAYNKTMRITSGYRCPKHPIEIVKTELGPHCTGLASDVAVEGADAHRLLTLALQMGFTGIGVNQKGSQRFLHLDRTTEYGRVWSY